MNLDALEKNLDNLNAGDRDFAESLIHSVRTQKRPVSEKQKYWLDELTRRAAEPQPSRATTKIGDLKGVLALFDQARKHLKWPKIVLGWSDSEQRIQEVRLSIAGQRARVPGSINVTDVVNEIWYGRILVDGSFEHSPRNQTPSAVTDLLSRFACDPVDVATAHGHLTGKCCFCDSRLTDERSTAVGYGPTCAKNYALPWGAAIAAEKKKAFAAAAGDLVRDYAA